MHRRSLSAIEFRSWRNRHGWTQQTAADQLGVSIRTVKAWEADATAIPYTVRLATKALDAEMEVPL